MFFMDTRSDGENRDVNGKAISLKFIIHPQSWPWVVVADIPGPARAEKQKIIGSCYPFTAIWMRRSHLFPL